MLSDGTIKQYQKISDTAGGFTATLANDDWFGSSVAALGDINGDGILDMVVGAFGDDFYGEQVGALYVIMLKSQGTVKKFQKISKTEGGFALVVKDDTPHWFGGSITSLGDINGDGVVDIAATLGNDKGHTIMSTFQQSLKEIRYK